MVEIKSVLFPTDFSSHSNKAFPYAVELAKAFSARLVLLHVAELEESDPANPEHTFPNPADFQCVIETERVVIRGHAPYKDILDVSRAKNCDLIVMATHGRSALSQFFLGGSVAEDVARFSDAPVFIVKVESSEPAESYTGQLKEIVFATDFSPSARRAYTYAQIFANRFDANLHAIHVVDEASDRFYKETGLERSSAGFRAELESLWISHAPTMPGAAQLSLHIAEGKAEREIIAFAENKGADLIVMGAHGHNKLAEEVVGTITDRVIRHAHCPVMTVRS